MVLNNTPLSIKTKYFMTPPSIQLSNRERQVLRYMSIEMSNLEIAKKLFISKSTVDKYRRNLLWKFSSKNSIGVIRKAYEMGILPMMDEDLLDTE